MNKIALSVLLVLLAGTAAQAAWVLDGEQSNLSFVSTKAINIAEVHKFAELSGGVSDDGKVDVTISLASVDTGIELRDDRMREMLFETEQYALAKVSASIDPQEIESLAAGESLQRTVEGVLELHGESKPLSMEIVVARAGDSRLLVMSARPVVVNAPEFKLAEGVEKLRAIAGLPSISTAVPVSFVLEFERQ